MRAAVAALGLLAAVCPAAPLARVVRTNPTIDLVDVATNLDAPVGSAGFQTDSLATTPSGTLISANPNGVLFDVTGPAPAPIGATGYASVGELDYAPDGLWGFGNATQTLFFYDLSANAVTYAQAMAAFAGDIVTGVAYRPTDGAVFVSARTGLNDDRLFVVPPSATSPTLVGAIADAASDVADIDFAANGALIAMSWFHRDFYTVNPTTAAATLIRSGPHRDVTGMALAATPVPEPTSLLAFTLGAALLRRREAGFHRRGVARP